MQKFLFLIFSLLSINSVFAEQERGIIRNQGQFPSQVIGAIDLTNGTLFIEKDGLVYSLVDEKKLEKEHFNKRIYGTFLRQGVHQQFLNSNTNAEVIFEDILPYSYHFHTPKTVPQVSLFKSLTIKNIYPEIDWKIYLVNGLIKYDFIVKPNANPKQIQWKYDGLVDVSKTSKGIRGNARICTLSEENPIAYQNNKKIPIHFNLKSKNVFEFKIAHYNRNKELIIDPILRFSTFTGGYSDNWGFTSTYDRKGNAIAGGIVRGRYYPVTFGALDTTYNGTGNNHDIVISKFDTTGSRLIYSTFIGGTSDYEPMSLFSDSLDNLYILGHTLSSDFPTVAQSYDTSYNGMWDIIVLKLDSLGANLVGSTYLGGNNNDGFNDSTANNIWNHSGSLNYNYGDYCRGEIMVDQGNRVVLVCNTKSANFPTYSSSGIPYLNHLGGKQDAVITCFDSSLSQIEFSTYLGGSKDDAAYTIHQNKANSYYIAGGTKSNDFGYFNHGYKRSYLDSIDGFIIEIDSSGSQILNGTYVGTQHYDQVFLLQSDYNGSIYCVGQTEGSFPKTAGKYGNPNGKVFIESYNSDLSQKLLTTTIGTGKNGGPDFSPTAFLVDVCGRIYIAGWGGYLNNLLGDNPAQGNTIGLPVTQDAIKDTTDGNDYYLIVLERQMNSLLYATFLGGNQSAEHVDGGTCRFDPQGIVYHVACAGCGGYSDFPTTPGAFSNKNNATNCNMAVFKFDFQFVKIQADYKIQSSNNLKACHGTQVQFQCLSNSPDSILWDFNDGGIISNQLNPVHIFTKPGKYNVKLLVKNCISTDTITKEVEILPPPSIQIIAPPKICEGASAQITASGGRIYQWKYDQTISDTTVANPIIKPNKSKFYYVTVTDSNGCTNTDSTFIFVFKSLNPINPIDTSICAGDSLKLFINNDLSIIGEWKWSSNQAGFIGKNNFPFILPTLDDTIFLQYTTKDGCVLLDSFILKLNYPFQVNAGIDVTQCKGGQVTLTASGGNRYLWNNGVISSTLKVTVVDSVQRYSVIAFQGICYSKPDTVLVFSYPIKARFTTTPDTGFAPQMIQFTNRSSSTAAYFTWDFGDGQQVKNIQNPIHYYSNPGIYTPYLIATSINPACSDTFYFNFIVMEEVNLVVPNAFSPNNDGVNDLLDISGYNMERIEMIIFNRWGEEIFHDQGVKVSWDGKFRGKTCPPTAYPYIIRAKGKNGKDYRWEGFVTLLR